MYYEKNSKGNKFSKGIIFVLTLSTITGGTIIAKASDNVINSVFSNHTVILDRDSYYVEESSGCYNKNEFIDFSTENLLKKARLEEDIFYIQTFNSDTSYTIILNNNEKLNIINNTQSLTRHAHEYEEVNINQHKKLSDGSCTTTIYEGLRCTICNTLFRGDVLSIETSNPCRH